MSTHMEAYNLNACMCVKSWLHTSDIYDRIVVLSDKSNERY